MFLLKAEFIKEQLEVLNAWQVVTLFIGVYSILRCLISFFEPKKRVPDAPIVGYRSILEPTLLLQARFATSGYKLIRDGYRKFKNIPFVVRRFDCDITILPMKYLVEVANIPETKCSGKQVHFNNLVPRWTNIEFMKGGDLHFRVVGNKLNRELYKFVDIARDEFNEAYKQMVPDCDDWTAVDVQDFCRMIVSRISARIFLGSQACHNQEWLKLSYGYSIDLFMTAFMLRMFPPWSQGIVAPFLPQYHRMKRHIRTASGIIKPLMEQHAESEKRRSLGRKVQEEDTLLHWMLDNATENEGSVQHMSTMICMLALASIHTTSMSVANMLFSICEHPEYAPMLVDEIEEVHRELGEFKEGVDARMWLSKLEKLDSYFIECLRVNPVVLLMPQRQAVVPLTLKDGTHIPAGSRVSFANYQHQNDPSVTPDPQLFDPLRCFRKRHSTAEPRNKFQAVQLDPDINPFGYGSQACPGRYFAVAEIKFIMARLLRDYEFKFSGTQGKPKVIHADENIMNDPAARMMMRKRR
ncbi:cytochrome P450 [Annulohypoxylon moriforme]|nr:cytochrome P450 [Annulohypoxylon moriforme]